MAAISERELTERQKEINDDPAYWDQFDTWWTQDFSWKGLKKHKIRNDPDGKSLQQYWRGEKDQIIEFAEREWTRFHLPPHDQKGEKSEKWGGIDWQSGTWKNWHDAILEKLRAASEYDISGYDTRAQLQGVCFPHDFDLSASVPENENEAAQDPLVLHLNAEWARFGNYAKFNNATFGDDANFKNATFGNAKFNNATFGHHATFKNATFGDDANFKNATFGNAFFDYATFGYFTRFNNATFGDFADFINATFGAATLFNNARFAGDVTFTDARFGPSLYFVETQFERLGKFHNCDFHQDTSFDEAEFALPEKGKKDKKGTATLYQSAFRVLRQHMEKLGHYGQAFKFARLEMQARERRAGSKDVPKWVRIMSRAYGLLSDYGNSIWRPMAGLGIAFILAAVLYRLVSWSNGNLGESFSLAFQSSLPPISYSIARYFGEVASPVFLNALDANWFTVLCSRLVMTVHGAFSIAMVFFLLLAVKRRFQLR